MYGLKGYLGIEIMPVDMAERHEWLWHFEHTPRDEDKTDAQRLADAERHMGMRQ